MFKYNPLNLTDGYKVVHKAMLAPNTDYLYGTWIPRSTKFYNQITLSEIREKIKLLSSGN